MDIASSSLNLMPRVEDQTWDYRGEFTKTYTHGFHSYPAMMIPPIARRLIEQYSQENDTILDPFCGSGSVLVEANLLSRNAWGIDLNPLALLIAKVKTTPIDPTVLRNGYAELISCIEKLKEGDFQIPKFFNLEFWFAKRVINQLARIKKAIEIFEEEQLRDFFLVAFSETVRLVSNSRSHEFKLYRYPAKKLETYNPNALAIFIERIRKSILGMEEFYNKANPRNFVKLIEADTRKSSIIPPRSIDLIVTSPPYGDSKTTVAYGQFSRLSLQWLGYNYQEFNIDAKSLGGVAYSSFENDLPSPTLKEIINEIRLRDEKRAREVLSFYIDFNDCLKNLSLLIKPKGFCCFVLGNRRVKQITIPTDIIIAELSIALGFLHVGTIVRSIPNKRMPWANSPTNIRGVTENTMANEFIVILRKG